MILLNQASSVEGGAFGDLSVMCFNKQLIEPKHLTFWSHVERLYKMDGLIVDYADPRLDEPKKLQLLMRVLGVKEADRAATRQRLQARSYALTFDNVLKVRMLVRYGALF